MQTSVAPSAATVVWPSAARGWTVAALLGLASIGSQFDRTVINLLIAPLEAAFGLDDTRFGMLQGVAFGIFYVLACIPIGRLPIDISAVSSSVWASVFSVCSPWLRVSPEPTPSSS